MYVNLENITEKIRYRYDTQDRKIREQRRINETKWSDKRYEYDLDNNIIKEEEKVNGRYVATRYEYNVENQVTRIKTPIGYDIRYEYDQIGRRTKETHIDKQNKIKNEIKYTYDKAGNIIKEEGNEGIINYTYDLAGKVLTKTQEDGAKTRYQYNLTGNIIKLVRPTEEKALGEKAQGTSYIYDKMQRIKQVKDPYGNKIKEYKYNQYGEVEEELEKGQQKKYKYDYLGNKIYEVIGQNNISYTYDINGQVTSMTENKERPTKFELDEWGRIVKTISPTGIQERYKYDYAGNIVETKLTNDTAELAKGCDVVCVFVNDTVDADVIDKLSSYGIKLIALRCAGYNNVDIEHAFGKIHVVHVPAYSPYAVAEHTVALLLTSVRRIHKAYNRTRDFNFSLAGLTGFDLYGKTVGVIGTGKIGRIFIDICRGFGMKVIAYDAYPAKDSGIEYVELNELFKRSDIISLHCPLTSDTRHIINSNAIERMKKGVVILNTSRGALIDAEALLDGIKKRKVGAACLDVYEEESDIFFEDRSGHILNDELLSRLISMPNVIVTSHQAFLTKEALSNIAETTRANIKSYFENDGICDNELCYRCGSVEHCKKERKQRCF